MGLAGAVLGGPEGLEPQSFVEKLATQVAFDSANTALTQAGKR